MARNGHDSNGKARKISAGAQHWFVEHWHGIEQTCFGIVWIGYAKAKIRRAKNCEGNVLNCPLGKGIDRYAMFRRDVFMEINMADFSENIRILLKKNPKSGIFNDVLMKMDTEEIVAVQKILKVTFPNESQEKQRKKALALELRGRETRRRNIGEDNWLEWERVTADIRQKLAKGYTVKGKKNE